MAIVEERSIGPVQRSALTSSFLGWMFDGFETSTMILVGPAAVTSLMGVSAPDAVRLGVGTALGATLIGWAVGGVIGSIMADYVGRKRMLMISIAGYCAFTALTAMSNTLAMLFALRFLTGIFLGSEWSTGTALVAETWPASARAKAFRLLPCRPTLALHSAVRRRRLALDVRDRRSPGACPHLHAPRRRRIEAVGRSCRGQQKQQ